MHARESGRGRKVESCTTARAHIHTIQSHIHKESERETYTKRERDIHKERDNGIPTHIPIERDTESETHRQGETQTGRDTDRERHRQRDQPRHSQWPSRERLTRSNKKNCNYTCI